MLNLIYPRQSQKSLPRSVCGSGRSISNPCSRVCRRGSASYYDGRSYSSRGRSPLRIFYSQKTSLRSTRNGLATDSKNYGSSPLRSSVCNICGALYGRNGLSYTKRITYIRVCRAWKRKTCLLSFLRITGRCYIQPLVVQYVPSRLALYSQ